MPHKVYLNCLSVNYKYVFYPIEIQLLFHQPPSCFVSFRVRCESGLHYGTHGNFQPKFPKADHCTTKHSIFALASTLTRSHSNSLQIWNSLSLQLWNSVPLETLELTLTSNLHSNSGIRSRSHSNSLSLQIWNSLSLQLWDSV